MAVDYGILSLGEADPDVFGNERRVSENGDPVD
jgi:hypothetical protein